MRRVLWGGLLLTFLFMQDLSGAVVEKTKPLKVPKFSRKGIWFNTQPLSSKAFQDNVTLLYFWDYTSVNCLREIGLLKRWYEHYHPYGLEMIWIHAPEFDFARRPENVEQALRRFKISFPVFLDNDFKMWDGLGTRSWPTKYLVNSEAAVVLTQVGEEHDLAMEKKIRGELRKINPAAALIPAVLKKDPPKFGIRECGPMVAETYVGYKRAGWWGGQIANRQWAAPNQTVAFKDRGGRVERGFFVEGLWTNREDYLEHARDTDALMDYVGMNYVAHEVYAVLSRVAGADVTRIYVSRDGRPVPHEQRGVDLREDAEGETYFLLQEPRLYYLIAGEDEGLHDVKLWTNARGVTVNSFSFSNHCLSDFEHF